MRSVRTARRETSTKLLLPSDRGMSGLSARKEAIAPVRRRVRCCATATSGHRNKHVTLSDAGRCRPGNGTDGRTASCWSRSERRTAARRWEVPSATRDAPSSSGSSVNRYVRAARVIPLLVSARLTLLSHPLAVFQSTLLTSCPRRPLWHPLFNLIFHSYRRRNAKIS